MNEEPVVSIIINNHNYGDFLQEAIESALAQTYRNTEVVVVDDGSTDVSRSIIADFGDKIMAVFKANGGQASAFNAGFSASRGDIICFLDSDDTLLSTAMAAAVSFFLTPDLVKAHWPLRVVDRTGIETGDWIPKNTMPDGDYREITLHDGPFYDSNWLPPTSGNAWARWFLEKVLPIPESEFRHGADVYLHSLAPIFGPMKAVPKPQGHYRTHGMNHYWGSRLDNEKITEYMGRFESSCRALSRCLGEMGITADMEAWKRRSFNYQWLVRLRAARQDIAAFIPEGATFILVDDDEWRRDGVINGRNALPFIERDGLYWGPPADDAVALDELARLREAGATHIVFWWNAFWWLEQYPGLLAYLSTTFRCALQNERLVVFDLRGK